MAFRLVLMFFFITGCATQTFQIGKSEGKLSNEKMQAFFVSGIGQQQEINPVTFCGSVNRIAKVEVKQTALDVFLHVISFTIYSPRTAYVYCK